MLLVGTGDGVVELDLDGNTIRQAQPDVEVTVISGDWAIADSRLLALDTGAPAELPDGLRPRCVLALGGGRALVGTSEARLVEVGGPGGPVIDAAFDAIPTRHLWSTPWGSPPDARSVAQSAAGILAGVHVGGVWRRDQDRWVEVVSPDADDHQVVAVGSTVAVAAAIGVGQSDDGGDTWTWSHAGLHGAYCRSVAIAEGWLLAGAASGPGARDGALYRRPLDDPERPFEPCAAPGTAADGLPERFSHHIDTFALAAAGELAAVATPLGDIYLSGDSGITWQRIARDLPGAHCVELAG